MVARHEGMLVLLVRLYENILARLVASNKGITRSIFLVNSIINIDAVNGDLKNALKNVTIQKMKTRRSQGPKVSR